MKTGKANILDTSVWIACLDADDSQHHKGRVILDSLYSDNTLMPDYLFVEILNVLKRKSPFRIVRNFLKDLKVSNIKIDNTINKETPRALQYFYHFKKLSFTDCLILATAKNKKLKIITFDTELQKAWNSLQK